MLSYPLARIKRLPKKIKREVYKIPILKTKQDKAYQELLKNHAPFLPKLNDEDTFILKSLQNKGTCVIPIGDLKLASTDSMLGVAATLV